MKKEKLFEIKSWRDDARSGLDREKDLISKRCNEVNAYDRLLDALDEVFEEVDDLTEKVERKQEEIDDLEEQLEQKDAEIADLRRQLLEAQNEHLESERQHLEAEVNAKPMEIHNHFGAGSNSQVFNDKVNGRFTKQVKKEKKDKKDKKNRQWKKIVRKML